MDRQFKVRILLDNPVPPKWEPVLYGTLTRKELLQLWRDFRKWILVQFWTYLLNKRHIVGIQCSRDYWRSNESVRNYLDRIMELDEWWDLEDNEE